MPVERPLEACRLLLVEDEYFLADELARALRAVGASVVGPVARIDQALDLVLDEELDGAVLDINLEGHPAFQLADVMIERRIPFVFATGYGADMIPRRFADVAVFTKPIDIGRLTKRLSSLIGAGCGALHEGCGQGLFQSRISA